MKPFPLFRASCLHLSFFQAHHWLRNVRTSLCRCQHRFPRGHWSLTFDPLHPPPPHHRQPWSLYSPTEQCRPGAHLVLMASQVQASQHGGNNRHLTPLVMFLVPRLVLCHTTPVLLPTRVQVLFLVVGTRHSMRSPTSRLVGLTKTLSLLPHYHTLLRPL